MIKLLKSGFVLNILLLTNILHANPYYDAHSGSDTTIWIAIFGLAIIGIFALYLSSERVKSLSAEYETMSMIQDEIQLRHNVILWVIGDRLQRSTAGFRRHRELFDEQLRGLIDRKVLEEEMVRFRRDENLLLDTIKDLNDFSVIRSKKVEFKSEEFVLYDLLDRLLLHLEPHFILKRNQLVFGYDYNAIGRIKGDLDRIDQILTSLLLEIVQMTYESTVVLSIDMNREKRELIFDIDVPENQIDLEKYGELSANQDHTADQYSSRGLKNHIALEMIRLMGGSFSVLYPQNGTKCRVILPVASISKCKSTLSIDMDIHPLVIAQDENIAKALAKTLASLAGKDHIDISTPETVNEINFDAYDHILITYAALEKLESELLAVQSKYHSNIAVFKTGFERNYPNPVGLKVYREISLPILLNDKSSDLFCHDVEDEEFCDKYA